MAGCVAGSSSHKKTFPLRVCGACWVDRSARNSPAPHASLPATTPPHSPPPPGGAVQEAGGYAACTGLARFTSARRACPRRRVCPCARQCQRAQESGWGARSDIRHNNAHPPPCPRQWWCGPPARAYPSPPPSRRSLCATLPRRNDVSSNGMGKWESFHRGTVGGVARRGLPQPMAGTGDAVAAVAAAVTRGHQHRSQLCCSAHSCTGWLQNTPWAAQSPGR